MYTFVKLDISICPIFIIYVNITAEDCQLIVSPLTFTNIYIIYIYLNI